MVPLEMMIVTNNKILACLSAKKEPKRPIQAPIIQISSLVLSPLYWALLWTSNIKLYCEHQMLNSIEQQMVHSIQHKMLNSIPARIKVTLSQLFHVLPHTRVQLRDPPFWLLFQVYTSHQVYNFSKYTSLHDRFKHLAKIWELTPVLWNSLNLTISLIRNIPVQTLECAYMLAMFMDITR